MLAALAVSVLLDALLGEPAWLYAAVPHPVVAIGRLIEALERLLLRAEQSPGRKRLAGTVLVLLIVGAAVAMGLALHALARALPWGWLLEGALMSTLLAWKSLVQHVRAVAEGLTQGLAEGRRAVAMIVGRDPESLDEPAVARAAIESLAENLSDGVVAPLLWGALLGLPGMLAYKAVNTLDSMGGHKSERYRDFGRASARLDDLVNLVPARATGLAIAAAAPFVNEDALAAWAAMRRDAPRHRSPNAGWPEAAMAAALGLALFVVQGVRAVALMRP